MIFIFDLFWGANSARRKQQVPLYRDIWRKILNFSLKKWKKFPGMELETSTRRHPKNHSATMSALLHP